MDNERDILIGIDLGATNVRVGVVTGQGELLTSCDDLIQARKGPSAGLAKIAAMIDEVTQSVKRPLVSIGIGATGPLDREKGCIQNPYTLPGWENVNIVEVLQERFGVPVALENDADAAALGESWIGAGAGVPRVLMVTVGTGIGTGFILDGQIYRGMHGEHPEGGHVLVDPTGPLCYCGANGCWESLASGTGMGLFARRKAEITGGYLMAQCQGDIGKITAAMLFAGARSGDSACLEMVQECARFFGLGLVSAMMLLLPDRVLLTGGVMRSFDLLEPGVFAVLKQHQVLIPHSTERLAFASLGQNAGMIGAARAGALLTAL